MLFEQIVVGRPYKNKSYIDLPYGEPNGYGEMGILCVPSMDSALEVLSDTKFRIHQSHYKRYLTTLRYNDNIGKKKRMENRIKITKDKFLSSEASKYLTLFGETKWESVVEKRYNCIYDIGHWNEMWFKYRLTINPVNMCTEYINFILSKIDNPIFDKYHKTIWIPIDQWAKKGLPGFGITKEYLDDPISIIMRSIFYSVDNQKSNGIESPIHKLLKYDIVFIDINSGEILKFNPKWDNKKAFTQFKTAMSKMSSFKINSIEENAEKTEGELSDQTIQHIENSTNQYAESKKKLVVKTRENVKKAEDIKQIEPQKLSVMGIDADSKEIPQINEYENSDEEDETSLAEVPTVDEEINDDIDSLISDYIDSEKELPTDDEITQVAKNVLVSKFAPDFNDDEIKRIQEYTGIQNSIIDQSVDQMASKIIPKSDFTNVIKSSNPNILHPKAKNFYSAYNKQKLESDIDNAVASLSNADYPLFIVEKKVEDTSDPMNLKKTYTYTMRDTKGTLHTISFDMPIIIDDRYILLGGNKKIIQNQMMLKPILKSGPDEVQIATLFSKNFIYRKGQLMDVKSQALTSLLLTNSDITQKYHVKIGNSTLRNLSSNMPLDYDILARRINEITLGKEKIIFDASSLLQDINKYQSDHGNPELSSLRDRDGKTIIGYNRTTREFVTVDTKNGETVVDHIINALSEDEQKLLAKSKYSAKKLMYTTITIFKTKIPLIFMICFCVGLTEALKRAKINYRIVEPNTRYDRFNESAIKLKDKWIIWDRYPYQNSLLLNGLAYMDIEDLTLAEMDQKDTFVAMTTKWYKRPPSDTANALDQFKNFMIDPISKEVLQDMGLPTDYVDLLIVANYMLNGRNYEKMTDMKNIRIRSNEILPHFVYQSVTSAYMQYRSSIYKKKPLRVSVAKNLIMQNIYGSNKNGHKLPACSMVEDASVLNPVLEAEKMGAVSIRGVGGVNMERAIDLVKRSYNPSMTGTIAVSTSPDANVGIQRQLTLDPAITSTRGYVQPSSPEVLKDQNNINLMSPAELLSPPGALHDDAHRTSMAYKQSKYMVLVDDSSPVLVGNRIEDMMPYYLSREFSAVAKDNGKVIAIENNIVVIQYKDGTYDSFSLDPKEQKNSAGGFYIETKFETNLKVGDSVKKDQIVAYNPKAFTKKKHDITASMNIGVLAKVAVLPNFDEYEDSAPVTAKLAERLATTIVTEQKFVVKQNALIKMMCKIGDHVEVGDSLIEYDDTGDDANFADMLGSLLDTFGEELLKEAIITEKAEYSGEIADIKFYSPVSGEELSPSLRPYVEAYWNSIKKKNETLEKYKNKDDSNYYKCGQLISEVPGPIEAKFNKILGIDVTGKVLVRVFIKHKDLVKKGDKITNYTALKGICSVVIDKGYEPFSEYHKDEEISALITPSAILARKVPSVFISMWSNKVLIELKRKCSEIYFGE